MLDEKHFWEGGEKYSEESGKEAIVIGLEQSKGTGEWLEKR